MSNITSSSGKLSVSDNNGDGSAGSVLYQHEALKLAAATFLMNNSGEATPVKRKRNLPGTPDPDAEVIALSPTTLLATNRFVCEICNKGFQRDQNLQLHRRGHNLPWKLTQRSSKENKKKVYVCPEPSCVHHDPSRALGDLTGIKKHFCRKHAEKKWKCNKCSKTYAVKSDWKAHCKTCGTREFRCDCGALFSRRERFVTHRAFCDALAEETARVSCNVQGNAFTGATKAEGASPMPMGAPPLAGNAMVDGFSSPSTLPQGLKVASTLRGPKLSLWPGEADPGKFLSSSSEFLVGGPQHLQLPHGLCSTDNGESQKPLTGIIQMGGNSSATGGALLGMSGSSMTRSDGVMPVGLISASFSLSSFDQAISHTAQTSATALLHKAAQMGAITNGPSFLTGFRMAVPPDLVRPPRHASDNMASSLSQSGHIPTTKGSTDRYHLSAESKGDGRNCNRSTSLHELMNSLSRPSDIFGGMESFSLQGPLSSQSGSMIAGLMQPPLYNQMQGKNKKQQHSLMGDSSSQAAAAYMKKADDASNDTLTRDFLGVGAMDIVESLKNIGASNLGSPNMDNNNFYIPRDSLQVGVSSNLVETHVVFNN